MKGKVNMNNRELKLTDLIGIAMKRIWLLIIAAIIGVLAGICVSKFLVDPVYSVKTKYIVDTAALTAGNEIDQLEAQRQVVGARYQVPSYVEILNTTNFAVDVAKRLSESPEGYGLTQEEIPSIATVRGAVDYNFEEEAETFTITVMAGNPNQAYAIARCIELNAEEYIVTKKTMAKDTLKIIDNARYSEAPVNVNLMLTVIICVVLFVALTYGICFFVDMYDIRIKNANDVQEIFGIPVIGRIPKYQNEIFEGSFKKKKKKKGE